MGWPEVIKNIVSNICLVVLILGFLWILCKNE